jgi:hypothetical protein
MKPLIQYFAEAATFADMAASSAQYGPLLAAQRERAVVPADLLARVEALGGQWHLLAISEDWCIDSQSTLPVIAALADQAANVDLRLVARDANPELMDAHLTNGTARSIPVVMVLDADYVEHAWWGSLPSPLQTLVAGEWKSLDKPTRNKEKRRWYAIDKGRTTLEEVIALLEQATLQPASASAGV